MGLPVSDTPPTLRERFRRLEDERRRSWTAEALAVNLDQREALVRAHPQTRHVAAGDTLPPAVLHRTDGSPLALDDLVARGPAVLIFFRFATCPACNIALPYYKETLWPALAEAGIPLVAVAPQPEALLGEIVTRHALPFAVATDGGLALSRALGITYVFDDASRAAAEAKGGSSRQLNGTDAWELPKPTVIVLDPGRVARFVDIAPDWMDRTEAPVILAALGLSQDGQSRAA
ncbi:peroxiredoxin-like family protein [Nguyenibacter vanlangensis]|uniref:AhpC/TSA family protein n=1 Tax=Nguyenibacter vanlangensis TaxID=1216886 RepID=A0A7Y7M762_9PROT|nr:peroxiredoxin-like family protein [Nguyenibacter vanlangensis]NVN11501.1 AhpC/TSA family protein [Nguyenibacter vanlangensis]